MRKAWGDSFPVVLAVWVLLVVMIMDLLDIVSPEQWDRFERISNVAMIIIAIVCLLKFYLKQTDDGRKLFHIISNISISGLAICMNVCVFRRIVRLEFLGEDIWGIHLFWLLFSAAQFLLLSGLAQGILNVIVSFLEEVKRGAKLLQEAACELIKRADKYVLCALFFSFIGWNIYIGFQIYMSGKSFIWEDTIVLKKSFWFWVNSLLIWGLVRIFPLIIQKMMEGVKEIEGRIMLTATLVLALAELTYTLPSYLLTNILLILILIVAIYRNFFSVRKHSQFSFKHENDCMEKADSEETDEVHEVKYSDLTVVILVFTLPLIIILVWASLQPEARDIFSGKDALNIATLLKFMEKVLEIAGLHIKQLD